MRTLIDSELAQVSGGHGPYYAFSECKKKFVTIAGKKYHYWQCHDKFPSKSLKALMDAPKDVTKVADKVSDSPQS